MSVHKVTYKGLSDIRAMSKKDLAEAGVGVDGDLVFDKTKGNPAPYLYIEDLSDDLLRILRAEGTFTVSEVDEDTRKSLNVEPIVDGQAIDDTGSTVRDGATGEASTARGGSTGSAGSGRRGGRGSSTGGGSGTGNGSST